MLGLSQSLLADDAFSANTLEELSGSHGVIVTKDDRGERSRTRMTMHPVQMLYQKSHCAGPLG